MPAQLSHRETRALFIAFADEELPADTAREVRSHLDTCGECQQGWQAYSSTVLRVRQVPRHKAPPALASQVLARVKRQRRSGLRGLQLAHAHYRLPVEVLIPVLLAAAVAAYLLVSSS
ncbi:transmembrane transcriptional regulator [Cystobacter fuscus]|uniref:Transmembrane transcriptional regulator n=1 Tax=Cystobacter fuscus TaxID=43 RepID=A0A250J4I1_9BACT|nr:anti-sigma factor [Cystobacter fuscus]ATB38096.1 transmembrane transcriptional regulator [Cystobacter fuscus]